MKRFLAVLFIVLLSLDSVSLSAGARESFVFCYTKDNLYEANEFDIKCSAGSSFVLTVSMYDFIRPDRDKRGRTFFVN